MYLDKQGASVLLLRPSPNRSFDKASQRMARLSTHLTLPRVVSCHTETEPKLSAVKHNWCHTSSFHSRMTYPWNVRILSTRQSQSLDWWKAFQWKPIAYYASPFLHLTLCGGNLEGPFLTTIKSGTENLPPPWADSWVAIFARI
jgi:hypothetical protein